MATVPAIDPPTTEAEDVGVGWILSRFGFEAWVRARLGWRALKAEEYVDEGYAFLSTPNIKGADIEFDNVNFITSERYDESPEIQLRVGDVLLAKDGSTLGTVNVVRELPRPATVNSSIAVISPGPRLDPIFLYYSLQGAMLKSRIAEYRAGMGVPHLFQDDIRRFPLSIPPIEHQRLIGEYLDGHTAKIDQLIEKQERLIDTLAERRQSVITHAVTKGLDPDIPMKDSGVELIGRIPVHWIALPLKRVISKMEQGVSPLASAELADESSWGVLKSGCVNRGVFTDVQHKRLASDFVIDPSIAIHVGDLLVSRASGSPSLVGSAAIVRQLRYRLILSDKTFRLIVNSATDANFVEKVMNSRLFREQVLGAISGAEGLANNLPLSSLKQFVFPIPPLEEQNAIVDYLDLEIAQLDALSAKAREMIETLKERRQALISAAVTGKIDVRGLS